MIIYKGDDYYRFYVQPRGPETNEYFPDGGFIQVRAVGSQGVEYMSRFNRAAWAEDAEGCVQTVIDFIHSSKEVPTC